MMKETTLDMLSSDLVSTCPDRQKAALTTAARLGARKPDQVMPLISVLITLLAHRDADVAALSSWAIGQIGYERPFPVQAAIPTLLNLLKHPVQRVRQCAVWSLGQIGEANPALIEHALPGIIALEHDPDPSVRLTMLWTCESLAARRPALFTPYIDSFIGLLDDSDIERVQREAPVMIRILAERNADSVRSAVPKLEDLTCSGDAIVRIHAREALRILQ